MQIKTNNCILTYKDMLCYGHKTVYMQMFWSLLCLLRTAPLYLDGDTMCGSHMEHLLLTEI